MVHSLDLKFIIHSGDYILNEIADKIKPLGNSVNIVHRLLKNKVSEITGWTAYIFTTENCVTDLGLNLYDYHNHTENYEHIGHINTFTLNLEKKYLQFVEDRRVYFAPDESDYFVERVYPVSKTVLWEWINNPLKRSLWLEVSDWKPKERPFGRTGKGATNHCANSNFFEKVLDYRPFEYYTSELRGKNLEFMLTRKFDNFANGTKFIWSMKLNSKLPGILKKYYAQFIWKQGLKIDSALDKLGELLKGEQVDNQIVQVN